MPRVDSLAARHIFAHAVAELIRSDDEEHAIRFLAVLVDAITRLILAQSIRLKLLEGGFHIIHLEERAFLRRVAAVFGEADLDVVSLEDRRGVWVLRSGDE